MPHKRDVFAVLVGIDRYPAPVSSLESTHKDVQAFAEYLQSLTSIKLHLHILLDEKATREAIIEGLKDHLALTKAGQTALFYFAGHGGREWAHPRFADASPDGRLEGILAYDSLLPKQAGKGMLVDKELRFLFQRVAASGAHLLSIFDCCHSGGNTRSQKEEEWRVRQFPPPGSAEDTLPAREWSDFLFASEQEENSQELVEEDFPEGTHVQLAACLAQQRASEGNSGGLFTQNMVRVLSKNQAPLSYRKLLAQVQQSFTGNHNQNPNYYIADKSGRLADAQFLLGMEEQYLFGRAPLRYDPASGWKVALGRDHGLQDRKQLFPVWDQNENQFEASIFRLDAKESQLVFEHSPNPADVCIGDFSNGLTRPLHLLMQAEPNQENDAIKILQAFADLSFVQWVKPGEQADYGIRLTETQWSIVRPGQSDAIIRPIQRNRPNALDAFADDLKHIARWHQLLDMDDQETTPQIELSIGQYQEDGKVTPCPTKGGIVDLPYNTRYKGQLSGRIDIGLTNHSNQERHVAMLYFDPHFMVYSGLLKGDVIVLPPGKTHWIKNLRLTQEEEVEKYNWPASISWIKVLSSNQFFSILPYQLPDLPGPFEPKMRAGRSEIKDTHVGIQQDWESNLLKLVMHV